MKPIPTRPVWCLIGKDTEGKISSIASYHTADEATAALAELRGKTTDKVYSIEESKMVVPDRNLPDKKQQTELGRFLKRAFVVLRLLGNNAESFEPIADLSDILHTLPEEMFDSERWDWNFYINALQRFRTRHPGVSTLGLAEMLEQIRDGEVQGNEVDDDLK